MRAQFFREMLPKIMKNDPRFEPRPHCNKHGKPAENGLFVSGLLHLIPNII